MITESNIKTSYSEKQDIFVLSSAIQKCIRRGFVEDALHYTDLFLNYFSFRDYLIKRILIYIVEDIGFANIGFSEVIYSFLENNDLLEKSLKTKELDEQILQLVAKLAISYKNREIDNCIWSYKLGLEEDKLFLDKFRQEWMYLDRESFGKEIRAKNLDLFNFLNLDLELKIKRPEIDSLYIQYNNNILLALNPYLEKIPIEIKERYLKLLFKLKELGAKDSGVLLYYTFFYLFAKNLEESLNLYNWSKTFYIPEINSSQFNYKHERFIPEFIFDKHTGIGKQKGRGDEYFFKEGATLTNEIIYSGNRYKSFIDNYFNIRRDKQ